MRGFSLRVSDQRGGYSVTGGGFGQTCPLGELINKLMRRAVIRRRDRL